MGSLLSQIVDAILYGLAILLYYLEAGLGKVLDKLQEMFSIFAGVKDITYDGESEILIDVFLKDEIINTIYKGMAAISLCLLVAFALVSIIRKLFDSTGEKVRRSYTDIIISTFKAALLMTLMTAIMLVTTSSCNVVMNAIDDLFNNAGEIANPQTIEFDDQDYANMFRVIDTVANYSVNPSPETRYNINICFNEISSDMQTLEASGIFNYSYEGAEDSWQYYLRKLYLAGDIHSTIPIDEYNDSITRAITDLMNQIQYNANFKPLSKYSRSYSLATDETMLGRTILLSSSLQAAKNDRYNTNSASVNDALRGPFYTGALDIYDRTTCENSFNIRFGHWDHLVCIATLIVCIIAFVKMIFNCVARLYNMIFLYIMAPPFIAVTPLDDGGKMKQWTTAFIIQSTSIIGVYVSIRLMIMFLPIVNSSKLVLFQNVAMNALAKCVLIMGMVMAAEKSSGIITGILADNAGMQSVMAGEIGGAMFGKITGAGKAVLGTTFGMGKSAVSGIAGKISSSINRTKQNSAKQAGNAGKEKETNSKNIESNNLTDLGENGVMSSAKTGSSGIIGAERNGSGGIPVNTSGPSVADSNTGKSLIGRETSLPSSYNAPLEISSSSNGSAKTIPSRNNE